MLESLYTSRGRLRSVAVTVMALHAVLDEPGAWATDAVNADPLPKFQLTARPWDGAAGTRGAYLDAVERLCRFAAGHVDDAGRFIDPVLGKEHQYGTPYFAFAAGVAINAGRAPEVKDAAVRAMDRATRDFAAGRAAIPDDHGEFYLAPLTEALAQYRDHVPAATHAAWRERLETPLLQVIAGLGEKTNNWRTYAMRGEWLRAEAGLVAHSDAVFFIEDGWTRRTQRDRIQRAPWHLYEDWNGHPQSHAVEAVGRVNVLAMVEAGYDGPSAATIARYARAGTATSLLLQDPTGQCPPNGRTDNHVFNDVLYLLAFEMMAERLAADGETVLASRYRRAATLGMRSIGRWEREAGPWAGMYSITKNHLPPADRVGYQPASQVSNYTGAMMMHLAEAYLTRQTAMPEQPAPCEVGGYAYVMPPRFGSAAINAGGMQVFVNLLGDSVRKYGDYWTPLGFVRFSRVGWDSRLGPSDGARDGRSGDGLTLGATWREGPKWIYLADMAEHYRGTLSVDFVHPLLVRGTVLYAPVTGVGGPSFYHDFTVTPDGALITVRPVGDVEFGLAFPVLVDDGRRLHVDEGDYRVTCSYSSDATVGDMQVFQAVDGGRIARTDREVLSTYGTLRGYRVTSDGPSVSVFVYPRNDTDPSAHELVPFLLTEDGFTSPIARVAGDTYVGRHAAGGLTDALDLSGVGEADVTLSAPANVLARRRGAAVTAVETDRAVTMAYRGETHALAAHRPVRLE